MDYSEKIRREKQIKFHWEEIRPHRDDLNAIMMKRKELSPMDRIIVFQTIALVAENIEIHEESIRNKTNIIGIIDHDDYSKKELIEQEIISSMKCLSIAADDKSSIEEKLDAIEKIRNTAWLTACHVKKNIHDILGNFTNGLQAKDIPYVYTCISVALLELDMGKEEAKILDELYG